MVRQPNTVNGWTANDTTYFVSLVERTADRFTVREVSTDKAYLSHKELQAVSFIGCTPDTDSLIHLHMAVTRLAGDETLSATAQPWVEPRAVEELWKSLTNLD